jgi:hypothetical protein
LVLQAHWSTNKSRIIPLKKQINHGIISKKKQVNHGKAPQITDNPDKSEISDCQELINREQIKDSNHRGDHGDNSNGEDRADPENPPVT